MALVESCAHSDRVPSRIAAVIFTRIRNIKFSLCGIAADDLEPGKIEAANELRSACIVENGNWKRKTTIDVKKRARG